MVARSKVIAGPSGGVSVPYTPEEELKRSADEQVVFDYAPEKAIRNAIRTLEASVTPRRIREMTTQAGKDWVDNVEAQIAVLRGQL